MNSQTWSALILALGLILAASVIALTWRSNKLTDQTITVTGSASTTFRSDLGVLRVSINATGPTASDAYGRLRSRVPILRGYLTEKGIASDAISESPMTSYAREEYSNNGMPTGQILFHNYSQRFEIQSTDVEQIHALSLSIASLVEQGVDVSVESPEYHFTGLDSLRIMIQAEAAANATQRAKAIVEATGRDIGPLTGARMGVLQITPVLSNTVSDYGMNDLSSIEKKIIGVVSATYRIY